MPNGFTVRGSLNGKVYWTEPVTGPDKGDRDVVCEVDLVWVF